ncbi:TetR/AcrR family transcriptional regulator [Marinobacterium jannaschii]|uniref:TetR/AcrR family transcriptional regulator n=1 Tax=Marinobacterium jannaschii TaxID=64970 RepID=UPI000480E9D6|nr:TetR/AcrR family transcriptional regulator [Marinobacterium jannaschii]
MASIRERNRATILTVASEVFADKGFAATKIIDIANKAGLPKPNVYYYFKSKEILYRSVLESVVEPLLASSEPFEIYQDPETALREYIKAKITISQNYPSASKVFASEIMHGAPHLPEDITERLMEQTRASVARIEQWIADGQMQAVDPKHLLFTIWASTQTYADFDWQITAVTGKEKLDQEDYDTAAELITRLVLAGTLPG